MSFAAKSRAAKRHALLLGLLVVVPAAGAAEPFASKGDFSVTYTFTTSSPAAPIDVGSGRDLTVNSYLATTIDDAGRGFLHNTAGHCTNIRFTDRTQRTIDSKGYCHFKDVDGDELFAEYTTGVVPSSAITVAWTFKSGTGKYDGIEGQAKGPNSNNLDDQGAYQAAGRMAGSYAIRRATTASQEGMHD